MLRLDCPRVLKLLHSQQGNVPQLGFCISIILNIQTPYHFKNGLHAFKHICIDTLANVIIPYCVLTYSHSIFSNFERNTFKHSQESFNKESRSFMRWLKPFLKLITVCSDAVQFTTATLERNSLVAHVVSGRDNLV